MFEPPNEWGVIALLALVLAYCLIVVIPDVRFKEWYFEQKKQQNKADNASKESNEAL